MKKMSKVEMIRHSELGELRMKVINEEPWFVAKDVCNVLGLVNNRKAVELLDDDEKMLATIAVPHAGVTTGYTTLQNQSLTVINESGMYNLIMRSRKPEARKFRKWVTSEVLPSIRRYGRYVVSGSKEEKRLALREKNRAKVEMLREVNKHLTHTDRMIISKKLMVDEFTVQDVLSGDLEDVTILRECFDRAVTNSRLGGVMYSKKGCEMMVKMLRGERVDWKAMIESVIINNLIV